VPPPVRLLAILAAVASGPTAATKMDPDIAAST
jgi:hypothetical protein